jgi:kynureninase
MTEEWLRENIWPQFSTILGRDEIYLANHSLGRPTDKTIADVQEALTAWYEDMDDAWGAWMREIKHFQTRIAELINAPNVVPKTSAGQGLRAVLHTYDRPIRIVTTTGEFDSLDFILRVFEERERISVTWCDPSEDALMDAIEENTDLLVFSLVMFRDAKILRRAGEVIARAHANGAQVFVDAYHAVGVIPVDMALLGADFIVGGSYKYMRGGPGACWLAYRDDGLRTLDTGWFAKKDPFAFERGGNIEWGQPFFESTPAILPIYQARAGIDLITNLGVEELRSYSLKQQDFLRSEFAREGVVCFHPADPDEYGAFSLIHSHDARKKADILKRAGVTVDARGDNIRFCPDILNTEAELARAAKIVAEVLR